MSKLLLIFNFFIILHEIFACPPGEQCKIDVQLIYSGIGSDDRRINLESKQAELKKPGVENNSNVCQSAYANWLPVTPCMLDCVVEFCENHLNGRPFKHKERTSEEIAREQKEIREKLHADFLLEEKEREKEETSRDMPEREKQEEREQEETKEDEQKLEERKKNIHKSYILDVARRCPGEQCKIDVQLIYSGIGSDDRPINLESKQTELKKPGVKNNSDVCQRAYAKWLPESPCMLNCIVEFCGVYLPAEVKAVQNSDENPSTNDMNHTENKSQTSTTENNSPTKTSD